MMDIQKAIDTLSAAANSSASKNWNYTPYVKAVLAHITELQQSAEKAEAQLARYSMSAGEADQRAAESRAVRNALGFCEEADDVAPCDLVDAINLLRAAPPAPVVITDESLRAAVRIWNRAEFPSPDVYDAMRVVINDGSVAE